MRLLIARSAAGKKNWVMIDTIAGAKASAIIYSIAETAKANSRQLAAVTLSWYKRFTVYRDLPFTVDRIDRR